MQNTLKDAINDLEVDIERRDIENKTKLDAIMLFVQKTAHQPTNSSTFHQHLTPTRRRMLQYSEMDGYQASTSQETFPFMSLCQVTHLYAVLFTIFLILLCATCKDNELIVVNFITILFCSSHMTMQQHLCKVW